MLYGRLENDEVKELIGLNKLKDRFLNAVFPDELNNEILKDFGYVCIDTVKSDIQITKDTILKATVKRIGEPGNYEYIREWTTEPYPYNVEERVQTKFNEIREERNKRLTETDYTQSNDYFEMKEEWAEYREKLRSITDSSEDPFLINFPAVPSLEQSNDIERQKNYAEYKINAAFDKKEYNRTIETIDGYLIRANATSLYSLEMSKNTNIFKVKDINNITHELTEKKIEDFIRQIKETGIELFKERHNYIDKIKKSETLEDIDNILLEIKSL